MSNLVSKEKIAIKDIPNEKIVERLLLQGFGLQEEIKQSDLEILNRLASIDIYPGDRFIPTHHSSQHRQYIASRVPENGGKRKKIHKYLRENLGFNTSRKGNSKTDSELLCDLEGELKIKFPLEEIKQRIKEKKPFPKRREMENDVPHFRNYYHRIHNLRVRGQPTKLPDIRQVLNSLHPEYPFLATIVTGIVAPQDISEEKAAQILQSKRDKKGYITSSDIKKLHDGIFWRWLMTYDNYMYQKELNPLDPHYNVKKNKRRRSGLARAATFLEMSKSELSHTGTEIKTHGTLSETLVYLLFKGANLLGENLVLGNDKLIFSNMSEVNCSTGPNRPVKVKNCDDFNRYPDLIVKSNGGDEINAVEVKNLRFYKEDTAEKIVGDLSLKGGKKLVWEQEGKQITSSSVVSLSPQEVTDKLEERLAEEGISVVGAQEIREGLEKILVKLEGREDILRGQTYSHHTLLQIYDIVTKDPVYFLNPHHTRKYKFAQQIVSEVLKRLDSKKDRKPSEKVQLFGVGGELVENDRGVFELFKLSSEEVPSSPTYDFIREKIDLIPEDVLFMDIESSGFLGKESSDNIFLIGTTYRQEGELVYEIGFARNPFEEAAILEHFAQQQKGKKIITYNGKTFDVPRIIQQNGRYGIKSHVSDNRHEDLFIFVRDKFGIKLVNRTPEEIKENFNKTGKKRLKKWLYKDGFQDMRLTTIGKRVFVDLRTDPSSSHVPKIYNAFLRYGNPDKVVETIEHNLLDLRTTAAVFLNPYLIGQKNFEYLTRQLATRK